MTREQRYTERGPLSRTPAPVTDQMRSEVVRLHGEGMGRNEIARTVGTSGATVTRICRENGLVFDTLSTELATRVEKANVAEIRARVAKLFILRAEEALADLDAPTLVGSFGGRDNTWSERLLDAPPADVKRNLMTIAAIGAQRHAELERFDTGDTQASEGASLLDAIGSGLQEAANQLRSAGTATPTAEDV